MSGRGEMVGTRRRREGRDAPVVTVRGEGDGAESSWLERSPGPSTDEPHRADGELSVRGRDRDEVEDEPRWRRCAAAAWAGAVPGADVGRPSAPRCKQVVEVRRKGRERPPSSSSSTQSKLPHRSALNAPRSCNDNEQGKELQKSASHAAQTSLERQQTLPRSAPSGDEPQECRLGKRFPLRLSRCARRRPLYREATETLRGAGPALELPRAVLLLVRSRTSTPRHGLARRVASSSLDMPDRSC